MKFCLLKGMIVLNLIKNMVRKLRIMVREGYYGVNGVM